MLLSGLAILVGLVAVGVNSYLIHSQGRVLQNSVDIIERTESIALDADLAMTLSARLATAGTTSEVDDTAGTLAERISRIGNDVIAMDVFLAGTASDRAEARTALDLVSRMSGTVRGLQVLNASIEAREEQLVASALRLTDIIATQKSLARLRITAGIWDLYSGPEGGVRPGLDRLADLDFFAFERLGELGDAVASMTRLVQGFRNISTPESLSAWLADYGASLDLAQARTPFMPSSAARRKAEADLRTLVAIQAEEGLIPLQRAKFATLAELNSLSTRLQQTLQALTSTAATGRTEVRARMQDRIGAAGRQAVLLTVGLALAVMASLATGYLSWARIRSRVVLRLDAVAERIVAVARGEPGRSMQITGHDEIGRLEKAFNILRRRAQEAARLRKSLEAAVLARTADVVAEMQSANAARAEAEELGRAKTHFLARMSHEIRTPLNGLIGMLDLLLPAEQDPERRSRLLTALTSARDLQAMTEDILAFSSGEDRAASVRLIPFDPGALALDLAEHLKIAAHAAHLRSVIRIPKQMPPVLIGDATRIRQVIVNLVSNAVKYTASGEVRLIISHRSLKQPDRHELLFTVSDTGPGMSPDEVRQAFDIYGRTVDARRRGLPGVGLGLAIVRQLTDLMGGELRVTTHPGQGSKFTLKLALAAAVPDALVDRLSMKFPPSGLRVLVVDDDLVNRLVARGYLENMGAIVTEAESGSGALEEAARSDFDAILLDLGLPDLRGDVVALRISRKGARVAILTADSVEDDAQTRARFQVERVLSKPVSSRMLADFLMEGAVVPAAIGEDGPEAVLRADIADMGEETTAAIVTTFLDDLATAVPHLIAMSNQDQQRRLAHRLKGAAGNFALHELRGILARIEGGDAKALAQVSKASAQASEKLRDAADRAGLQLVSGRTKQ